VKVYKQASARGFLSTEISFERSSISAVLRKRVIEAVRAVEFSREQLVDALWPDSTLASGRFLDACPVGR